MDLRLLVRVPGWLLAVGWMAVDGEVQREKLFIFTEGLKTFLKMTA
jgi:hypothetical protein